MGLHDEIRKYRILKESWQENYGRYPSDLPRFRPPTSFHTVMGRPTSGGSGEEGKRIEKMFIAALHLVGFGGKNFLEENSTNGRTWDVLFKQYPYYGSLINKQINFKIYGTDWVGGIGRLNSSLPFYKNTDRTDDDLTADIKKWINEADFDKLVLLKPASRDVQYALEKFVEKKDKRSLWVLLSGNNWVTASLAGDPWHVCIRRDERDPTRFIGFSINRGYPPAPTRQETQYHSQFRYAAGQSLPIRHEAYTPFAPPDSYINNPNKQVRMRTLRSCEVGDAQNNFVYTEFSPGSDKGGSRFGLYTGSIAKIFRGSPIPIIRSS